MVTTPIFRRFLEWRATIPEVERTLEGAMPRTRQALARLRFPLWKTAPHQPDLQVNAADPSPPPGPPPAHLPQTPPARPPPPAPSSHSLRSADHQVSFVGAVGQAKPWLRQPPGRIDADMSPLVSRHGVKDVENSLGGGEGGKKREWEEKQSVTKNNKIQGETKSLVWPEAS